MHTIVRRLPNNLIYVQKIGDQTEESMVQLFQKITDLARELRAEGKPVLILSDVSQEGAMNVEARQVAAKIGKQLDYDKSATYGARLVLETTRKLMIEATKLETKVRNFETRAEAEAWLLQNN